MSISGCIISQGQQKGPGTLNIKVSSDPNPEETLTPGPLYSQVHTSPPSLGVSNDHVVSSTPTSHPEPDSHTQSSGGYGDLQLCFRNDLSKETRPSLRHRSP